MKIMQQICIRFYIQVKSAVLWLMYYKYNVNVKQHERMLPFPCSEFKYGIYVLCINNA